MRLRYEEFVPFASPEIGKEVRIHHCRSGKDNDKLFIKRTEDGTILGFCHHCHASGRFRSRTHKTVSPTPVRSFNYGLPSGSLGFERFIDWHPLAKVWISKYLSFQQIRDLGVLYYDRLIFPITQDSEYVGYMSRKVLPEDPKPKWLTMRPSSKKEKFYWYCNTGSHHVAITEDIISAKKISEYCSSYALLGSHLSSHGLAKITKNHNKFYIFMDDDKPNIKVLQSELKRRLELFGDVTVVHAGTDPKNLSGEECDHRVNTTEITDESREI